ncbi:hypothetical protein LOTGIDRAFT_137389 [Lottia gigantea]|uniref:SH3 domain-containing protein n=1 Tax=Lottia gigantea TaxID=225164 RepID=V4CM86_LOTGI|nr:hypothetical protein LOTGIDRAFT_137389 [Lottia gigantea]ESP03425.1 hypothetical protein LOTGIDRAFT_137389 [Lottia gigantea]
MYRALYDYKSNLADYFTFEKGDKFTLLEENNDDIVTGPQSHSKKDWLLAQNGIGQIGYVPYNYIDKFDCQPTDVIKFIDGSIEAIHLQAGETGGVISHIDRENLQKLLHHRNLYLESVKGHEIHKKLPKRQAPQPPVASQHEPVQCRKSNSGKKAPPPPPCRDSSLGINSKSSVAISTSSTVASLTPPDQPKEVVMVTPKKEDSFISSSNEMPSSPEVSTSFMSVETSPVIFESKNLHIPSNIGSELIEEIRINTGLSFDKSKVALETVLGYIGFKVPPLSSAMDDIFKTCKGAKQSAGDLGSRDAQRLEVIFSELADCKDDSQQRSWALHEDEKIISEYLQELISILENAKKSISCKIVRQDNYQNVHNLVEYYQMETRRSIRLLLLQAFGSLCGLDKQVITSLLFSVLPFELSQDIFNKSDDVQFLSYVTLVLSMIFSSGEMVPSNLHIHLNEKFIDHVFDLIENPTSAEHEEVVTESLVTLILAYNLHMEENSNIIMKYLSQKGTVKIFTEKVMLLFNRGDDPVKIFDHKPKPANSVIKFFQDLYASKDTSNLLYTNDEMVLVDILIRQITDLPSGDSARSEYLILLSLVVKNSEYHEHCHRSQEMSNLLMKIESEETCDNEIDRQIAKDLLKSYPKIFKYKSNSNNDNKASHDYFSHISETELKEWETKNKNMKN